MKCFWTGLLLLSVFPVFSQDTLSNHFPGFPSASVVIDSILISGNAKTKDNILLRELPFAEGDTLSTETLQQRLTRGKQQLINTSLFVEVALSTRPAADSNHIVILLQVKERWYLLPVPYFRLVDRNFNQWWHEQHRSLNRVNYGLKLIQNNVTGHNDNAYLWLISGYSHQVAGRYELPYIDKQLHQGISIAASYLRQRELNYGTSLQNKQLFYKGSNFVRQQLRLEASYLYRPAIRTRHMFTLKLMNEHLSDTILQLNRGYFPYSRTHITYPSISYTVQYSDADNITYPTKGFTGDLSFTKKGFGEIMNLWQLNYHGKYTIPLRHKTQLQLQSAGIISLPFKQPFFNKQIVNYSGGFFFRGMEYYVIDGVAATINRATLRRQLFAYTIHNPVNIKNHQYIPVRFYLKAYGDAGYVYSNETVNSRLNNKFIGTYGLGLDIVSIYDVVIRLEYSFNQMGEHNLYFHSKGDF